MIDWSPTRVNRGRGEVIQSLLGLRFLAMSATSPLLYHVFNLIKHLLGFFNKSHSVCCRIDFVESAIDILKPSFMLFILFPLSKTGRGESGKAAEKNIICDFGKHFDFQVVELRGEQSRFSDSYS